MDREWVMIETLRDLLRDAITQHGRKSRDLRQTASLNWRVVGYMQALLATGFYSEEFLQGFIDGVVSAEGKGETLCRIALKIAKRHHKEGVEVAIKRWA